MGIYRPSRSPTTAKRPAKVHLRLRFGKREKAPHCGALWMGCGRLRLRPFILCFYRTAFTVQKSGLKSSIFRPKPFPQISPKSYRYNAAPNRSSLRLSTSRTNSPHSLSRVKMGTHSAFGERSHTAAHTAKQGRFRWGRYYYPRTVPHVLKTLRGQRVERRTLPLLGLGRGVLSKNAESLRDSDALMRVAVPRRRGPAGLRNSTCLSGYLHL